ncbi:MAG TPA: hypothetical protein VHW23_16130 [Kofleriaceae bacterium]|jgi:hypothetical protein|nr:hypothetical protein [Kofleriaceae bacterium]
MSNPPDPSSPASPSSAIDDALGYWWPVFRGDEIARAFMATPEAEAWQVIERHPALLLPELVDAAERMFGRNRALDGLREMHHVLRGSVAYAPYHRLLVAALVAERRGSRRVNLERALAVIQDVRRAAPGEPGDDPIEQALRAELAALVPAPVARPAATAPPPVPAAKPPTADAMFLDEAELPGFRRGSDRRDANPHPVDRAYATHGGLAAGSVEWLGDPAAPVYRLVDARWVFASTRAAKAYLDSPATHLLASDALANPALVQIGDGAHAWDGGRSGPGGRARQCLLFRVDRVVAQLHVTDGPDAAKARQALARPHLLPYADAVVRRLRRALAEYWLAIGNGMAAAHAFVQASPRTADRLLAEYPILLLPEFPTAMALLGEAHRAAAERLAVLQGAARGNWQAYRERLRGLVRNLLDETAGEPRINADAALRLVSAHRRLDADPAWTSIEAECAARASGA